MWCARRHRLPVCSDHHIFCGIFRRPVWRNIFFTDVMPRNVGGQSKHAPTENRWRTHLHQIRKSHDVANLCQKRLPIIIDVANLRQKIKRVCKFFSHAKKLEKTNFVANLRQKRNSNDLANPRRKRKSDHVVHLPKSALPILIDVVYLRQKGLRVFKFVAAPREGKIKMCSQSAPKEIIKWCSPPSPKVRTFNRVYECLGQINSWKFEL